MLRIAICDNEILFAEQLKERISEYMIKKGLVFEIDIYSSGEALLALGIEVVQYMVIFLDINLEKIDGIMVTEKIRKVSRDILIVFVTSDINFSLEGYRLGVVRYLLKGNVNFQNALNECLNMIIDRLHDSVSRRKFDFMEGKKEVLLDKVVYIESNLHKLKVYVMEREMNVYTMYEKLSTLEERLAENNFIRIHQSFLVNIKYIKNVVRYKVILINGVELAVPRVRYAYVKEQFTAYQDEM